MYFCSSCVKKVQAPEGAQFPQCTQCRKTLVTQTPIIVRNSNLPDESRALAPNEIFLSHDILMMGAAAVGNVWGEAVWEIALPGKVDGAKYYAKHVSCTIDLSGLKREKSVIIDTVLDEATTVIALPSAGMLCGTPLEGARADGKLLLRLLTTEAELKVARLAMTGEEGVSSKPVVSDISRPFSVLHDDSLPANACRVNKGVATALGKFCRVQVRTGKNKITSIVSVVHIVTTPAEEGNYIYMNLNIHNSLLTTSNESSSLTATVVPVQNVPRAVHVVLRAAFVHFNLSTSWPEGKVAPYHDVMEKAILAVLMQMNENSNGHATILSVGMRIDDGLGRVPTNALLRQLNEEGTHMNSQQLQRDAAAAKRILNNVLAFVHVADIQDDQSQSVPAAILHSAGVHDASFVIEGFGRASTPKNTYTSFLEAEINKASLHGVIQMAQVEEFIGLGAGAKTPILPFLITFTPRPPASNQLKLKAAPSGSLNSRLVAVIERNANQAPLVLDLNDREGEEFELGALTECKAITVVTNDPDAFIYAELYDPEDFEDINNDDGVDYQVQVDDLLQGQLADDPTDDQTDPLERVRRCAPSPGKLYKPVPGSREPVAVIDVFPNGLLIHMIDGSQLAFMPSGSDTDEILGRVLSGRHPFEDSKVGDEIFEVKLKYSSKDYEETKTPNFGPSPGRLLGKLRPK